MSRYTIEHIKQAFENEGYSLISNVYLDDRYQKLEYVCPNGHTHSVSWHHWHLNNNRCPYCAKVAKPTIDFIKQEFEKEAYVLLTKEYKNNRQNLNYTCPNGHKYYIKWHNWQSGRRCPCFSGRPPLTIEFIRSEFLKEGCTLLSTVYSNAHTKLKYRCINGHTSYMTWSNFKKGHRCMTCFNQRMISDSENSLFHFLNNYLSVVQCDRFLIHPYELDIVIPSKKIAIEYCGLYWHSELMGKGRKYHIDKLNKCLNIGYRLITIFDDEWFNKRKVTESRLLNILGLNKLKSIHARKCLIKVISAQDAMCFCNENHLQGYTGSCIKVGAFYNDELISIMTFSRPSIAKGYHLDNPLLWELSRFCSKIGYRIVGVASKLLTYFKRNYEWDEIFSYADRRWSDGNVYEKMGFKFDHFTQPNYWYTKGINRIHRFNLRKKYDDPKDVTEWELRKAEGWNRIWDCGNLKYIVKNNN